MERLNAGATVTYGATVSYGGAELFTVVAYCSTVGKFYYRGQRNLWCHRKLRWRSFSIFFVFGINGFPDSFGHVLKPVRLKHFVFMKCRYILDAGRRSSSTKDRTRYRYMLPHCNTLQILNNEFNHDM
ncbi:hypothetical protein HanPI659440_Chr14g0528941 [Helianthus annuus]|nr:hypothetical protein HanPI659440_Chr14g0528941 [Helianthus annuus]